MNRDDIINKLWEESNHGTRREDIEAAFDARAAAEREECAKLCDQLGYSELLKAPCGEAALAAIRIRARSKQ